MKHTLDHSNSNKLRPHIHPPAVPFSLILFVSVWFEEIWTNACSWEPLVYSRTWTSRALYSTYGSCGESCVRDDWASVNMYNQTVYQRVAACLVEAPSMWITTGLRNFICSVQLCTFYKNYVRWTWAGMVHDVEERTGPLLIFILTYFFLNWMNSCCCQLFSSEYFQHPLFNLGWSLS